MRPPPTWLGATVRGVVLVAVATGLTVLFGRSIGDALLLGAFLLVAYVPLGYALERRAWRRRERARVQEEASDGAETWAEKPARKPLMPKPQGPIGGLVELVVILGLALALALGIQAWVVKPYKIPSASMEPTIEIGQRILANRFIYHFTDPAVGDIIVFSPPAGAKTPFSPTCGAEHASESVCPTPTPQRYTEEPFTKRIVAGPGDRLRIIHGQAIVNGELNAAANDSAKNEPSPYGCGVPLPPSKWDDISSDGRCNFTQPITVPPGHYFMMGDNRGGSSDSRYWGPIPREWIIGKVVATYWPPDRMGIF